VTQSAQVEQNSGRVQTHARQHESPGGAAVAPVRDGVSTVAEGSEVPLSQGLTLVHFSAQRKHFLWDRGCIEGLFSGSSSGVYGVLGGIRGCLGCIFCQKWLAQVELKSGRV